MLTQHWFIAKEQASNLKKIKAVIDRGKINYN
jgi:hypothetical protein